MVFRYTARMSEGIFISFEGGEGSGKSTQMARLASMLRGRGLEVIETREPGGTPLGEAARNILLDPAFSPDGLTELFLLEASRHDHVEKLIRPALEGGAVVLADRFADSSTVYQGMVRGLDAEMVRRLNAWATGGLEPRLTLVFDLDPAEGLARALGRNAGAGNSDRLDEEPAEFHRMIRDAFLRLASIAPGRIRIIDASGSEDVVFGRVMAALDGVL